MYFQMSFDLLFAKLLKRVIECFFICKGSRMVYLPTNFFLEGDLAFLKLTRYPTFVFLDINLTELAEKLSIFQ